MRYEECLLAPLPEVVRREVNAGDFRTARKVIDSLLHLNPPDALRARLLYEIERMDRLRKDFPFGREEALAILRDEVEGFVEHELDRWIADGYVDRAFIDGEERFYSRFVANLFFLNRSLESRRRKKDEKREKVRSLVNSTVDSLLGGREPATYRVRAGINVKVQEDLLDTGEKVRVWLPFPRPGGPLRDVKLISAYPCKPVLAEENAVQRTAYFESREREFRVEFEYVISEQVNSVDPDAVEDGGEERYLEERAPHILFTPYLRDLARRIVGDEKNPYLKAKRIYDWITTNVRYSYVREFCTYENIPEFVATELRGDCGMQALLFIALCRIVGVPAKWQSGWFITPHSAGPHDWAQFYVAPYGWLPADLSFGGSRRNEPQRRQFYFGNLDAFRMIANDDVQGEFQPRKKYLRSDPVDNQRGEVEWEGGNIYYDGFEYRIYVREFKKIQE